MSRAFGVAHVVGAIVWVGLLFAAWLASHMPPDGETRGRGMRWGIFWTFWVGIALLALLLINLDQLPGRR